MVANRIHFFSGILVSLFIVLHLFNHAISVIGVAQHIAFMNETRVFYRNIIVESILLLSVLVQIFTGIQLFSKKRKDIRTKSEKLQAWTGFYLAFFMIFHLSAVFIGRYILNVDTNFYFGVAGLNVFPLCLFFLPYYGLAIFSAFSHIAIAFAKRHENFLIVTSKEKKLVCIISVSVVVTGLILYGTTNGFRGYEIPKAYHLMIKR